MDPRIIALYLPQFYRVPENDYWWGKDFTDWVSAKNATPLFEGHYQPHEPFEDRYYDLLEKETMMWQAQLMKEYGVDGLCFYHYWFGCDKMMLEKPAENLLKWKDIDMPFCFCWANMSWARSWAKMDGMDYWIGTRDEKNKHDGRALLIEQIYGDKEEWDKHFNYLMPFFADNRYIKIDEKPVFWIYRLDLMPDPTSMINYMQEKAKLNGLKGIFFIGSFYRPEKKRGLDAAVIYEPGEIIGDVQYSVINKSGIRIYSYDEYWRHSIDRNYSDIKTFYTGLVNYDSTARQGYKGEVIAGDPEKFEYWIKRLLKKAKLNNNELVFLNAWNEWGEGNHIEPDKRNGYGYLKAILSAKKEFDNLPANEVETTSLSDNMINEIDRYKSLIKKVQTNLSLLSEWLTLRQKGKNIADQLISRGISHIAIYGYGDLGKLLLSEFENTLIIVDFIVDKSSMIQNTGICFYSPEDIWPRVDLVIVSLPNYYQEVLEVLNNKKIENYVLIDELIRGLS